jgi:uncharacterized protein YggE
VDQVRLDVADRSEGLSRARDAAFADARAKAEQYAGLSRSELGSVLGVAESGSMPLAGRQMKTMALAMDAGGMPVEGGDLDLIATVTVTWALA